MVILSMRMTDEQFKQELFDRCNRYDAKRKRRRRMIFAVCIPLFCAGIFTAVFAEPYINEYSCKLQTFSDNLDTYTGEYDGGAVNKSADDKAGSVESKETQTENTESENSAVYYSKLNLSEGEFNSDTLELSDNTVTDIAEFNEDMLSQGKCCMIIEGTVTNLYVKHYNFDVYDDKFEKNSELHNVTDTVVYEVAVDKTWYGDDVSGETITIEDVSYFTEPIFALKTGKRYVLPLCECGESVYTNQDYAGGNVSRESTLSTIYPYHPQIEVTNDGSYLISDDWKTLTSKNTIEVIMDTLNDENYYYDKMCLVDADTFTEQMNVLISSIK